MIVLTPKPGLELPIIEVPEDASNIQLYCTGGIVDEVRWNIVKPVGKGVKIKSEGKRIPPGNYLLIATTKDITEEQAAELVKVLEDGYEIYDKPYRTTSNVFDSLFSLLRSQGLDPDNKVYAILKKI